METAEDALLAHFGVMGMHWGVRRNRDTGGDSPKPRGKPMSVDVARVQKSQKKLKSRGLASLSNAELKALNERMNLEQNYARLTSEHSNLAKAKKGHDVVKQILDVAGTAKKTYELVNSPMVKDAGKLFKDLKAKNAS